MTGIRHCGCIQTDYLRIGGAAQLPFIKACLQLVIVENNDRIVERFSPSGFRGSSEFSSTNAVNIDSGVDDDKGSGSVRFNNNNNNKTNQKPVRPFLASDFTTIT